MEIASLVDELQMFLGTPVRVISEDPLEELVATILSQNTTDTNSHRAFEALRERFPTWRDVRDAPREELLAAIHVAGLAKTKAETIQTLLRALDENQEEPSLDVIRTLNDEEALQFLTSFRGIGVKTAACVLLFGLGREVCPVDTHVHRVLNRLGVVKTKSPEETFFALRPLVPEGKAFELHVLLVRFGRRICRARNPRCGECVLFDVCTFEGKTLCVDDSLLSRPDLR